MGILTSNGAAGLRGRHLTRLELQRDRAIGARVPLESSGLADLELVTTLGDVESVRVVSSRKSGKGADGQVEVGTHIYRE